jgi:uncharacterized membrane protein
MQDFLFFLGRFHVLVLHLPIGIAIAAVALDWTSRGMRQSALAQASPFLWGAAAISAVATAVLGYLHFAEGSFTGTAASAHRLFGTITALACVAQWWLATRDRGVAGAVRLGVGAVVLALLTLTGHYGGNLTHGSEYLRMGAVTLGTPKSGATSATTTADAALVQELIATGFLVRQVSQIDPRIVVAQSSPSTALDAAALAALAHAAPVVVDLNLANADLDDAELAAIGALTAVTHLRLARNRLTDASASAIAALPALLHLNLYGNGNITDAALATLGGNGSLREIYLWQTAVTAAGVEALRKQRPDVVVDLGAAGQP